MRSALLFATLVCLLAATAVLAQGTVDSPTFGLWTPRAMGMGNTGVGVADDAAAWFQNPAGLGALRMKCEKEGQLWGVDAEGSYAKLNGQSAGGFNVSAWQPTHLVGVGFGYGDIDEVGRAIGVGFGMNYGQTPFSYGLNYVRLAPAAGALPARNTINLGLMYRFEQPDNDPLRLGLRVRDLGDSGDNGMLFDLGVAWPVTSELLFAADVLDIGDKVDTEVNAGAEYWFGPKRNWTARVGVNDTATDTNATFGLGYVFSKDLRIDGAWIDTNPDTTWSIAGTYSY